MAHSVEKKNSNALGAVSRTVDSLCIHLSLYLYIYTYRYSLLSSSKKLLFKNLLREISYLPLWQMNVDAGTCFYSWWH